MRVPIKVTLFTFLHTHSHIVIFDEKIDLYMNTFDAKDISEEDRKKVWIVLRE